jgi:hypothetical protein
MPSNPEIKPLRARLVFETPPNAVVQPQERQRRLYRPLVVGPVLIRKCGPRMRWGVRVSSDGRLMPKSPHGIHQLRRRMRQLGALGIPHRVAACLVAPQDMAGRPPQLASSDRKPQPQAEFYGWSLMYQLPGGNNLAFVDQHERFAELPAFYELPLELIDRTTFLAARGILSRPIALITQPLDFVFKENGRPINRFYPEERFRRPAGFDWLC